MMWSMDRPPLCEATFTLLRDLIHDRLGIHFDVDRRDLLEDKLASVIAEHRMTSYMDLYYALRYENDAGDLWREITEALTVKETYFWREMDAVWAVARHLVPDHVRRFPGVPFVVWSAACATGEEPLSLAMALDLEGWWHRAPIRILATDISDQALKVAQTGLYRGRSFRALPLELRDRYFTPTEDAWLVKQEILEKVRYRKLNLMDREAVRRFRGVHVIFCRNVFIYFSDESIRRTADAFHEVLTQPGHLFLGAAESLLRVKTPFELTTLGKAFVYVKR